MGIGYALLVFMLGVSVGILGCVGFWACVSDVASLRETDDG